MTKMKTKSLDAQQQYLNRKHNDRIQPVYLLRSDLHELNWLTYNKFKGRMFA